MKRRQNTNFVDDIKVIRPGRRSRTSKVDLINGSGVGEDLGLVQESFNAIGPLTLYEPKKPEILEPDGPSIPTNGTSLPTTIKTSESPTIGPTESSYVKPIVDAGSDQQITLPTSSALLEGSVRGHIATANTWSFISGPQGASPTISNPNSTNTDVSNLTIPGDYTFKLYAIYVSINGDAQSPSQFNNSYDTVVVTVLPAPTSQPPISQMPPPATTGTIDGWNCNQLNTYLNVYNQVLSDPTLTQATRVSYENALLYINNRINTVCNPSTTPTLEVPTEPTSETVPPLPTVADINAMNCDQLNGLKTALVVNESSYRTDSTTLQNYINTVNYVDLQFTQKCKNTTPTAPTVEIYAPGTTPYSTGVKSTGSAGIGGLGGGGGSSSKATGQPAGQKYKTWWWIGAVVVVGALLLFKPGTKVGVPAK